MNLTERIIEQIKIMEGSPSRLGVEIVEPPYTVCGVTYSLLRCSRQREFVARLSRAKHEGLSVHPRSDGEHVCIQSGTLDPASDKLDIMMTDDQFRRAICGG